MFLSPQKKADNTSTPSNGILKKVALFGLLMMAIWVYVVYQLDISVGASKSESSWGAIDPGVLITFFGIVGVLVFIYIKASKKPSDISEHNVQNWVTRKGKFALKPGVELQLLECNNELLLLSVSDSAASLIHKIPKDEWEENLVIDDLQGSQESFSGMIQQYFKTPLN